MTQAELNAGAQAVMRMAHEHGYGSFISLDVARSIAAAVIKAYEATKERK